MTVSYIIKETLLMMGFTFVVGIAFAYLLKTMKVLLSFFGGDKEANPLKVLWRAYRKDAYRSRKAILVADDGFYSATSRVDDPKKEMVESMDSLTEYRLGEPNQANDSDPEMNKLQDFYHGEVRSK